MTNTEAKKNADPTKQARRACCVLVDHFAYLTDAQIDTLIEAVVADAYAAYMVLRYCRTGLTDAQASTLIDAVVEDAWYARCTIRRCKAGLTKAEVRRLKAAGKQN